MFRILMNGSQMFITKLDSGKFINATDIEPSAIALTMKSYFTFQTNILTLIIYITILLLTAFIPTVIGLFFLTIVVIKTGSKVAIRTKRISESLVNLRAKYKDLITERFLGWKTIKTFNTLDKERLRLDNVKKKFIKKH